MCVIGATLVSCLWGIVSDIECPIGGGMFMFDTCAKYSFYKKYIF
jgi:hypothetical protein